MPVAAFNETKSFFNLCDLGICFPSLGRDRIHSVFFIFQVTLEHVVILKLTYWEEQNKLFYGSLFSEHVGGRAGTVHRSSLCGLQSCNSSQHSPVPLRSLNVPFTWPSPLCNKQFRSHAEGIGEVSAKPKPK